MSKATNLLLIKLETSFIPWVIVFTITVRFNNLAKNSCKNIFGWRWDLSGFFLKNLLLSMRN